MDFFGPRRTNRLHKKPKYGPGKYKFEVYYYRQTYVYLEKMAHMQSKLEKSSQEVLYYSKCINCNYIEFAGYETCYRLIWK